MSGETIGAAIPPELQDRLRQAASAGGESVEEIVSSALGLYMDLPQAARHTAHAVREAGTPEAQDLLRRETARAVANAGFENLRARLVARGKELGTQDPDIPEEEVIQDAVEAVNAERRERRARESGSGSSVAPATRTAAVSDEMVVPHLGAAKGKAGSAQAGHGSAWT